MLRERLKRLFELCRLAKAPKIPKEEYDAFWESRCWLALRQEVAAQIDHYQSGTLSPASNLQAIYECRGSVRALLWLLDAKKDMAGRIAKNIDEVQKHKVFEDRLRDLIHLIEREKQNEWISAKRGKSRDGEQREPGNVGSDDPTANKPVAITLNQTE